MIDVGVFDNIFEVQDFLGNWEKSCYLNACPSAYPKHMKHDIMRNLTLYFEGHSSRSLILFHFY